MSKSGEKASKKEQDEPQNDSVFDFLYCDTARIGSFLAQFDDSGHLKSLTQHESAALGVKRGFKLAIGGGATVVGTGGTGTIALERGPSESGAEGLDRVYDPLWTNARTFLDFIADRHLIRNLREANIGNFVQISGRTSVIDIALMKHMLENTTLKRHLIKTLCLTTPPSNRQERRAMEKQEPSETEIGMELLPVFPLTAQATMYCENEDVAWSTLSPSCLTIQAGDLLLQYGIDVGEWHMLAILDAKPDVIGEREALDTPGRGLLPIALGLAGMIPAMRDIIGRPSFAYGVTPLLIFRDVAG